MPFLNDARVTAERTFAESQPPSRIDWRTKSYITSGMEFLVSVLWIGLGLAFLRLARSYLRTGPQTVGIAVGVVGAAALGAGLLF